MSLRTGKSDIAMFGFYVRNNVGIAFRSFGSGLFFGVGAIFFLVYNGLFFGAFAGEISNLGYEKNFYSFVCGHGSFELTALVLAGASGLRVGFALLIPGPRRRFTALREEARQSLTLVGGAAVYLVVAAAIEAFWSGSAVVSPGVKFSVGGALWILVFSHLILGDALVDLERIAAVLRPRTPWESIDQGFEMARAWWKPLFSIWLTVLVAVWAIVLISLHRFPDGPTSCFGGSSLSSREFRSSFSPVRSSERRRLAVRCSRLCPDPHGVSDSGPDSLPCQSCSLLSSSRLATRRPARP